MRSALLIFVTLLLCAAGCDKTPPSDGIRKDGKLVKALKEVPETVVLDDKALVLSSELWRDFMPAINETERSMRAAVSISDKENVLPDNLEFKRLVVIKKDSVWVKSINNSERSDNIRLKANTLGGPEWAPTTKVDVVVEFIQNDKAYKLRQNGVEIRATY